MSMKGDNPTGTKKFRTYKGKRIERPETDSERKDRCFAGYNDMRRASIGIYESEPGEDEEETDDENRCLVDDELSDDDYEDDDDCLIPMRWADLATGDKKTRDMMRQTISESRQRVTEKKKKSSKSNKKKNCSPGNPYHDSDGEFGKPGETGSWSIGNKEPGEDCNYGKLKRTGKGKQTQWTKRECGRKDVDDPSKKAKHRCKDGSVVTEQDIPYSDEGSLDDETLGQLQDRLQKVLDREPMFLKHLSFLLRPMVDLEQREKKQRQREKPQLGQSALVGEKKNRHKGLSREQVRDLCARSGFFGWTDFLMKLNAIEAAKKGNIPNRNKE